MPLVLVSAGHAKGDIPAALAREQERHPGLSYRYGRPLGPHPALLRRAGAAAGRGAGPARDAADRADVTVLLVGRGSTDPDANAEVHKAARLLWEGRGYAGVETAFVSLAAARRAGGAGPVRRLGARRIVVLPYFLFTGVLPDRVRQQTQGWAAAHPERRGAVAEVIGAATELRRAGDGAVREARARRHADELRHLRVPDRAARLRGQGRAAAAAAPPPGRRRATTHHHGHHAQRHPLRHAHWPRRRGYDLRHHGDAEVATSAELVDLAVNVRAGHPAGLAARAHRRRR